MIDILDDKQQKKNLNLEISIFLTKYMPIVSLEDYIYRLVHYIKPEFSSFCLSLVYLDRFAHLSGIIPTEENIYRLYLICFITAIKYNEESSLSNRAYSNVGGISITDLNTLEKMFLKLIDFNLYVNESTYREYLGVLKLYI
jgi:hypothetical protein